MIGSLDDSVRRFLGHAEATQVGIVNSLRLLGWREAGRLLAKCYPDAPLEVKYAIADAAGSIAGVASKSLLLKIVASQTDETLRWVGINSLTSLMHLRLGDMDMFYAIASSPEESVRCRETAIYGLMRIIEWFHRKKEFDPSIWRSRLPGLKCHVRSGEEEYFEQTLRLVGI